MSRSDVLKSVQHILAHNARLTELLGHNPEAESLEDGLRVVGDTARLELSGNLPLIILSFSDSLGMDARQEDKSWEVEGFVYSSDIFEAADLVDAVEKACLDYRLDLTLPQPLAVMRPGQAERVASERSLHLIEFRVPITVRWVEQPPVPEQPVVVTPEPEPPVSEPPVTEPPITEPPVTGPGDGEGGGFVIPGIGEPGPEPEPEPQAWPDWWKDLSNSDYWNVWVPRVYEEGYAPLGWNAQDFEMFRLETLPYYDALVAADRAEQPRIPRSDYTPLLEVPGVDEVTAKRLATAAQFYESIYE